MGGVIDNAKCPTDHLRHALPGPHLAAEAIGLGATAQQVGQMRQQVGSQAAGRAGRRAMAEGLRAVLPCPFQPLADGGGADPQGLGNVPLGPTLLPEMPGLQSARFFPVVRDRVHA